MTTVALQKIKVLPDIGMQHSFYGAVTNKLYLVDPLGRVVVDTRDAAYLLPKGWAYARLDDMPSSPTAGVATINFGAFPGAASAQTTIAASDIDDPNAVIDAWIVPIATADHTADEHSADPPLVSAQVSGGNLVINAFPSGRDKPIPSGTAFGQTATSQMPVGEQQPTPYGAWSVAWAFSP